MYNYLDFSRDDAAAATQNGFQTILFGTTPATTSTAAQYEHSHWIQCNTFVAEKNRSRSRIVWTDLKTN